MLIANLLITGSVAYASVKTVVEHHRSAGRRRAETQSGQAVYPTTKRSANHRAQAGLASGAPTLPERRQRTAAATAMWLGVGGLFWSPLTIVGAPLTLYSAVSIFEAAGRSLYSEGRLRPSVINSILLVSTLATEHYLPAATISWLHHTFKQVGQRMQATGEQMATEMEYDVADLLRQAAGGSPQMVWVLRDSNTSTAQSVQVKIPFADLKTADVLVISRGEFIPVNGVVTSGEATISLLLLNGSGARVAVGAGEQVYRGAFVTEGSLQIKVDRIQES